MLQRASSSSMFKNMDLAKNHYENFPVLSPFLPKPLRVDVANLYAFCRIVDDLGDEYTGDRLAALDEWEADLLRCWHGRPQHPALQALQETIHRHQLNPLLFQRLFEANRRDQRQMRYNNWDDLLDYCTYSANPVGRLYLAILGVDDEELNELADATCTALQLTNFWQDISEDAAVGRIYIPHSALEAASVSEEDLLSGRDTPASAELINHLTSYTESFYRRGMALLPFLPRRYAVGVRLFSAGGLSMLSLVKKHRGTALSKRRQLSYVDKGRIIFSILLPRRATPSERRAFAYCARLTQQHAGNFRLAITTLPRSRRRAIYALYAYCRVVDDAADLAANDAQAASNLAQIHDHLHECLQGNPTGDIFTALAAVRHKYPIRTKHLYAVLAGVQQDLYVKRYETYDKLRRYCWHVASAVGLLCVSVFGSKHPDAHAHAEDLGLAMQLTNILRDVNEDLQRERIYLPQEDMAYFGVDEESLRKGRVTPAIRLLFCCQVERARTLYASGAKLIPYLPRFSRLCPMAMYAVYSQLLTEIEKRDYDVFSARVHLSTGCKLRLLGKVWWQWLLFGM